MKSQKPSFVIRRTTTGNSGAKYVQYLRGQGVLVEFARPGDTATGVGVANLKTWGTRRGAQRWMDQRPGWVEAQNKIGVVEIVASGA